MSPDPTVFPAARFSPNWRHACAGVCRLTLGRFRARGHWLALGGLLVILGLVAAASASGGRGSRFLSWIADFYVTFLVPIVAFISAAGSIRDELKAGSADYVFTRPVRRPAYMIFRYLAQLVCAEVDFLFAFAVVAAVAYYRHTPGLAQAVPLLLLGQVLTVAAFAALGFLCGILTSRYLIVGLVYGAIVEVGVGQIPTQLGHLSMTHQVRAMLQPLLPASSGAALLAPSALSTVCLLAGFSVIMLAAAGLAFSLRELSGARSGDL